MTRALLAGFLLLPITASFAHAASNREFERGIVILAEYHDRAKSDALVLSAECARNGHCGARYDFYRLLYNRTVNAFEVLIKNMITKMDDDNNDDNDLYFGYTVENAAVQYALLKSASVKLRAAVDSKSADATAAPAIDLNRLIDRTQRVIAGTFVRLVRAYRKGGARERQTMLGKLDALRWNRFEDLRSVAAISEAAR